MTMAAPNPFMANFDAIKKGTYQPTDAEEPPLAASPEANANPYMQNFGAIREANKPVSTLGAYGRTLGQAFKGLPASFAQTYEGGTPYDEQTKVDELIAKQQAEDTAFANQPGAEQPAFGGLFGDSATMGDIYQAAPSMRSSMAAIAPVYLGAKAGGA
jgi:hypothetical protein